MQVPLDVHGHAICWRVAGCWLLAMLKAYTRLFLPTIKLETPSISSSSPSQSVSTKGFYVRTEHGFSLFVRGRESRARTKSVTEEIELKIELERLL